MAVLLSILKIIGIVLLIIIGIILILSAVILFAPIKYEARGVAGNGNGRIKADVRYLFGAFRMKGGLSKTETGTEYAYRAKFFGKKISSGGSGGTSEKEENASEENAHADPTEKEEIPFDESYTAESGENMIRPEEEHDPVSGDKEEVSDGKKENKRAKAEKKEHKKAEKKLKKQAKKQAKKINKGSPGTSVPDRIRNFLNGIIDKKDQIEDRVYELSLKKDKIEDIFFSGEYDRTFDKIKKQSVRILKHIKPRQIKGYVDYGTQDPYSTGLIYSAYSLAYRALGDDLLVTPDFENKIFKGDVETKGKIRLFVPVTAVVSLLLSKKFRQLVRDIKSINNRKVEE